MALFMDSRSSLIALTNPYCFDLLVEKIHVLREGLEVSWFWVKAHVGITGNKMVDRLAKQGAAMPNVSVPI